MSLVLVCTLMSLFLKLGGYANWKMKRKNVGCIWEYQLKTKQENGFSLPEQRERLTKEWYAKRIEEEKERESKKKAVFDHIKFNWDLLLSKDPSKEILFDIVLKINQLLDYLQENE